MLLDSEAGDCTVLARPGCDTCAHPTSATTAPVVVAPRRKLVRVELRERMGQPVDDFDELRACLHVPLKELACQPIGPSHGNLFCRPVSQLVWVMLYPSAVVGRWGGEVIRV